MSKIVIPEHIIKKALNESIDRFMIEESGINGFRSSALYNSVRNAIANYMYKRTNGAWNEKYNIYPNSNYKSAKSKNYADYLMDIRDEYKYLSVWFTTHAKNINSILHYKNGPNFHMYRRNSNGFGMSKEKDGSFSFFGDNQLMGLEGATEYIESYCTYKNYLDYVKQYYMDYQGNPHIENYIINEVQANATDPSVCLQKMNIRTFTWSKEGRAFNNQSMSQRNQYYNQQLDKQANVDTKAEENKPKPNNNGMFDYESDEKKQIKNKIGWVYSTDANGKKIWVNPNNPKQAVFVT